MRHTLVGFVVVLCSWLAMSDVALACFGAASGTFAEVESNGSTAIRGLKGYTSTRVNDTIQLNDQHIHPAQIQSGGQSNDFYAIGNARGALVPGTGCGDDYDQSWEVYVDGRQFGDYFCNTVKHDNGEPVTRKWFKLARGNHCANNWFEAKWGSAIQDCRNLSFQGEWEVAIGIEVLNDNSTPNIDAKYDTLRILINGSWHDFLSDHLPATQKNFCKEHAWDYKIVNDRQMKFYEPPYD